MHPVRTRRKESDMHAQSMRTFRADAPQARTQPHLRKKSLALWLASHLGAGAHKPRHPILTRNAPTQAHTNLLLYLSRIPQALMNCTKTNAQGCSVALSDSPTVAWFSYVPTDVSSPFYPAGSGWGAPGEDVYYTQAVEFAGGTPVSTFTRSARPPRPRPAPAVGFIPRERSCRQPSIAVRRRRSVSLYRANWGQDAMWARGRACRPTLHGIGAALSADFLGWLVTFDLIFSFSSGLARYVLSLSASGGWP